MRLMHDEKKAYVKRGGEDGASCKQTTYDIAQQTCSTSPAPRSGWAATPLQVGRRYEGCSVFTGTVSFTISAEVDEKTKITTRGVERDVYKIHVFTEFTGQLKQKRDLVVYMSGQQERLQASSCVEGRNFILGHIQADLVHFEPGRDFSHG